MKFLLLPTILALIALSASVEAKARGSKATQITNKVLPGHFVFRTKKSHAAWHAKGCNEVTWSSDVLTDVLLCRSTLTLI